MLLTPEYTNNRLAARLGLSLSVVVCTVPGVETILLSEYMRACIPGRQRNWKLNPVLLVIPLILRWYDDETHNNYIFHRFNQLYGRAYRRTRKLWKRKTTLKQVLRWFHNPDLYTIIGGISGIFICYMPYNITNVYQGFNIINNLKKSSKDQ